MHLTCSEISNNDFIRKSPAENDILNTRAQQLLRWVAVCPQQTSAECGGNAVPLLVGGAGSDTMSPGARPTSVPSGNLIHPIVWPQYTNVTDRQTGRRSRGMGRTVTFNGRPISQHLAKLLPGIWWHFLTQWLMAQGFLCTILYT